MKTNDYQTRYDRPCYKCLSHYCPGTCAEPHQEPIKISHCHQWFRTGAMKIGEYRCIECGTWGHADAFGAVPEPTYKPAYDALLADWSALVAAARAVVGWHETHSKEPYAPLWQALREALP